jgi:hypothetical protein
MSWKCDLACGDKVKMMWEARKGAPHERGAHITSNCNLGGFHMKWGANPPRGRIGLSEVKC